MSEQTKRSWWTNRRRSFGFAFRGWKFFVKSEAHARIHVAAAAIAISFGFGYGISWSEWLWILLSITIVLVAEIFNTAIEGLMDLVHPGFDQRAGQVKDLCAAAVLMASVFAFVVACVIFIPRFRDTLSVL